MQEARGITTAFSEYVGNILLLTGSSQDRDGAALTLHSAIETAVKEVGEAWNR